MDDTAELAAIRALLTAGAPEKEATLENLWKQYPPTFHIAPDQARFVMEAGPWGAVVFTGRAVRVMWLLGFASQRALYGYAGVVALLRSSGLPFEAATVASLAGQAEADAAFADVVERAVALMSADHESAVPWPTGVPRPEMLATNGSNNVEDQATFELTVIGASFAFLHEYRHVILAQTGERPLDPRDEELDCDRFAAAFLTEEIDGYAKLSGYDASSVRNKRASGIAIGWLILMIITPRSVWGGTEAHPPIRDRIEALADQLALDDSGSLFWLHAACAQLALLKWAARMPSEPVEFWSIRELFAKLLAYLP